MKNAERYPASDKRSTNVALFLQQFAKRAPAFAFVLLLMHSKRVMGEYRVRLLFGF